MKYVYIVAASKLGTVMLKLAREDPFYRTWPRSNVYCLLCAAAVQEVGLLVVLPGCALVCGSLSLEDVSVARHQ